MVLIQNLRCCHFVPGRAAGCHMETYSILHIASDDTGYISNSLMTVCSAKNAFQKGTYSNTGTSVSVVLLLVLLNQHFFFDM